MFYFAEQHGEICNPFGPSRLADNRHSHSAAVLTRANDSLIREVRTPH